MPNINIKFCGASQTVTGSSYLITTDTSKVLIDCGMYQGDDVAYHNNDAFMFEPSEIDFLILTHAHLDHCGLIPKLVKAGFKGRIVLTPQTSELTKIILYDSAKLQELSERMNEDYNIKLYDSGDVDRTVELFYLVDELKEIELKSDLRVQLIPAGHILGSISVVLKVNSETLIFSGDLGRRDQSIIKRFSDYNFQEIVPQYIIMESLYGGIVHDDRDADINTLLIKVKQTLDRKGKVIIPVFAMHRAQEMLELFKFFVEHNYLRQETEVYLDSPMAIDMTDVYRSNFLKFNNHIRILGNDVNYSNEENITDDVVYNGDRFNFSRLNLSKKSKKSQRLVNIESGVIMAGSGMADGGRVVRHLYNNLENPNNTVIFVGFQAEGTLGRQLVSGEKKVQINGRDVEVKAEIVYLRGFSAHADQNDLLAWMHGFDLKSLKHVYLVHGEIDRMQEFAQSLNDQVINNSIPKLGDEVSI